jgi:uncharacterized protein
LGCYDIISKKDFISDYIIILNFSFFNFLSNKFKIRVLLFGFYKEVFKIFQKQLNKLLFSWDETKNISNIQKHGISFEEAITVFTDEYGLLFMDEEHSDNEERWILLGFSQKAKLLVVVHAEPLAYNIRIISARKATNTEYKYYEKRI